MINDPTPNASFVATTAGPLGNQRGIALIVAISLLAIMSILGAMLLNTSTSEIQLSGNYRNSQEAFYAADRAVEYSAEVVAATGSDTVDLNKEKTPDGKFFLSEQVATNRSGLASGDDVNTVTFLYSGPPPIGSGSDATGATGKEVRYYAVSAVGIAPRNATNPSRQGIRAQVFQKSNVIEGEFSD